MIQQQLPFDDAGGAGSTDAAAATRRPASPVIARSSDPETSKAAAASINSTGRRQTLERQAVQIIRNAPGHTAKELEFGESLTAGTIHKRIAGLVKAGKVARGPARVCRISGHRAATLLPVYDAGRKVKPR